jgi:THO complex subunit 1
MATVNSFLRHNSKDLFLEAGRGTQKSIEDEDFLTHIPSPLQEQIQQLLATRTSAANNNAETETESCTIIDRVEQFQFGTRDHVLSISKALLESLSKNDAAILEETVEELLSFIRNVIDVILHVFYIHCTNIPSDDDDDDDDGTDGDVNEKASSVASLCSEIVTKGIEIRKIPFLILEDLVETLPTKTIQLFWNYGPSLWLEDILCKNPISFKHHKTLLQNNPKLKKENLTLFTQGSQYCILRLCNRLLKNISVDSSHVHAQFAGQITMTLAKVFPLSEKSAVNNLGKFNVESIIQFESLNDWYKSNNSDSSSSKGKASTESEKKNMGALNYDFYNSFWTLQQYFTNPVTLLPKAMEKTTLGHDWTNMETFMKTVESVLTAFESNQFPNRLVKDLKSS